MNKSTSLLLDAVRFVAALVVFADHGNDLTGGFLWRFPPYGPEAVIVFFVLSGFVIAHATASRETTFGAYAIARAARIYSVAIPALILTVVADAIGRSVSTALYSSAWHYDAHDQWLRLLASATFVNELWRLSLNPGSNWSYWSLGYEVWYYVLFAAAMFLRGRTRIAAVAALLLIAGPTIDALLPLWLLGAWAYRICRSGRLAPHSGALLALGSLAAWTVYEIIAWHFGRLRITSPALLTIFKRPEIPQDYLVGIAFAGALIGFRAASAEFDRHVRGSWTALRWMAGATFSLYLFHEPLLRLFATVDPFAPKSWLGRTLVLGGTLICVFVAAEFTERRKGAWRRALVALAAAARPGRRRSCADVPVAAEATDAAPR